MSDYFIGFMSGTSIDGIDASLVKTDGENQFSCMKNIHKPFESELKNKIRALIENFTLDFLEVEKLLTKEHSIVAKELLSQSNLDSSEIKAIGFHGQAIYHDSKNGYNLQIGNPNLLARETGIDVIYDFRKQDMAYGGYGAPIVPIFHQMLARQIKIIGTSSAMINIGGVSNITYIGDEELIAFDLGTGGALIDDAMRKYFQKDYDEDGNIAASGKIHYSIVDKFISDQYYLESYPKSLDRNYFAKYLKELDHLPDKDKISTLTAITATSIIKGLKILPSNPQDIFLCGGGSHNKFLISLVEKMLKENSMNCNLSNITEINDLNPDFIESMAFGYLTARYFKNLPSTYPQS